MTDEISRFRIKPEFLEMALANFRTSGAEPSAIVERSDGGVSVEFRNLTDEQASAIAKNFRPEHSAIIGVVGGSPFESQ